MAPPAWKKPSVTAAYPDGQFVLAPPTPRGEVIGIVGSGGIGKTLLACLIERVTGPVGFIDLDDSLPVLRDRLAELDLHPQCVSNIKTWATLIGALESSVFDAVKNIAIDTCTEAQNLAMAHTCERVPLESGATAKSIESYGYGKGYRYLHDTWLDLRTACKNQAAQGRNVILIMHDTVAKVPNPEGADFIRYEPNLHQDTGVSLRRTTRDMLDHLFYVGYDVSTKGPDAKMGHKFGKASGSGTRTIYCAETPTCMAKSRALDGSIPYEYGDDALWRALFNVQPTEGS